MDNLIKEIKNVEEKIKEAQKKPKAKIKITEYENKSYLFGLYVSFLISATLLLSILSLAGRTLELEAHFICLLIFSVIYVIYVILIKMEYNKIPTKLEHLEKQLDDLLYIDERAIKFYKECKNLIEHGNNEEQTFYIIGQKFSIDNLAGAKEFYKKGEQEIKKQEIIGEYNKEKEKAKELAELHEKEQNDASEESDKRWSHGKDKYLKIVNAWLKLIKSQKGAAESLETVAFNNSMSRAKTSDWAIAGGIGSALGGAGLGLAAAATTQANNEKAKAEARLRREKSSSQSSLAFDMKWEAEKSEKIVLKYLQAMEDVLIDNQNVDEKFKLLEFADVKISLTKGNNLCVQFVLTNLAKPTVLSRPAIFDGSLKIEVLGNNDNVVSTGYYVADGHGLYNYKNAGFKKEQIIEVTCPIDIEVDVDKLKCRILPDALWYIEESEEIFAVDNKKLTEDYESFKKAYNKYGSLAILSL